MTLTSVIAAMIRSLPCRHTGQRSMCKNSQGEPDLAW
jgi:hypothetical protein